MCVNWCDYVWAHFKVMVDVKTEQVGVVYMPCLRDPGGVWMGWAIIRNSRIHNREGLAWRWQQAVMA